MLLSMHFSYLKGIKTQGKAIIKENLKAQKGIKEVTTKEEKIAKQLTFRSCHEAEDGKPVTKTAYEG